MLTDRVKEILNVYQSSADISTNAATEAILQAFREVLPEKKFADSEIKISVVWSEGWNAYHDALMEQIK